jgi:PmbA protein
MNIDTKFAARVVERARSQGASGAEVLVYDATEFSCSVRLGEIETLTQAGSKGLGLRVLIDGKQASVSTSDFTDGAIDSLVREAVALARATSVDDSADLPEQGSFATVIPDLEIYDPALEDASADSKIDLALRGEQAALDADPRISNFDRGGVSTITARIVLANSHGFAGDYRSSSASLVVIPIAEANGEMQRGAWYDMRRKLADLDEPETVGRIAAQRTLRRLGARKIQSCEVPIVFEPTTARDFVTTIFQAVSGDSIFRKASFLVNQLGEEIASRELTVVDDGLRLGGLGSRPFDGEGVPTRRTTVIDKGRLESYLLNTYTSRKLGMESTGNASRGLVGSASVGAGNMYIEAGTRTPKEIIGSVKQGLLVTELLGFGVNIVNGDYSRGASGHWIENGEIAYPVHEVTIAGSLKDMLRRIAMVGNDLEFRGRLAAPTLLVDGMVVSGR